MVLSAQSATRSSTSICLKLTDPAIADQAAFVKALCARLDRSGVAHDIAAYRDAPPGLRLWGGSTVEASDLEALMPWLDWAHGRTRAAA